MTTEKRVSVRLVAVGGDKVKAEFRDVGVQGEQAMRKIGSSSKQMGMQLQNASYQVGDFFVQVAGGTHPMRAMAMQLPQLLGGFGAIGAVAGAAASITYVLAQSFLESETKAKTAKETVDDLNTAVTSYAQAAAAARTPIEELTKKYGDLADEVQRAHEAQRVMRADEARRALTDAAAANPFAIPDRLGQLRVQQAGVAVELQRARDLATRGIGNDMQIAQLADEMARLRLNVADTEADLEDMAETFGLSVEQMSRLMELSAAMRQASGPAAMAAAAETLRDELLASYGTLDEANKATGGLVGRLNEAVIAAADIASTDMAGGIEDAAAAAGRLARNLLAAQQSLADKGMVYSGRGGDPRTSNQKEYGEFGRPSIDKIIEEERAKLDAANKGSKGGTGRSTGQKALNDDLREAARLYDQTRTNAERYATEQANINDLLAKGHIDAETAARGIRQLDQRYRGITDAASQFNGFQSDLKESLLDAAATGESAFGRIGDAIKRAAAQMLLFGEGPFASLLGGATWKGLLGGLFSFDGGGDTGNAPRSGGLDGKGGFLAMLHPRETVIDRTRGQRAAAPEPVRIAVETTSSPYFDTRVAQISGAGDRMSMRSQRQAMPGLIRDMQARGLK